MSGADQDDTEDVNTNDNMLLVMGCGKDTHRRNTHHTVAPESILSMEGGPSVITSSDAGAARAPTRHGGTDRCAGRTLLNKIADTNVIK